MGPTEWKSPRSRKRLLRAPQPGGEGPAIVGQSARRASERSAGLDLAFRYRRRAWRQRRRAPPPPCLARARRLSLGCPIDSAPAVSRSMRETMPSTSYGEAPSCCPILSRCDSESRLASHGTKTKMLGAKRAPNFSPPRPEPPRENSPWSRPKLWRRIL